MQAQSKYALVPQMSFQILLVDDDPRIIDAFSVYLAQSEDFHLAATASNGREVLSWLTKNQCDIVLSDIRMPEMNGLELLQQLQTLQNPPLFVGMTAFDSDALMLELLRLGAAGYILKGESLQSILDALSAVSQVGTSLSPTCVKRLVRHTLEDSDGTFESARELELTNKEREILKLLSHGYTNSEIAAELCNAEITVRKIVSGLFLKFGVRNRVALATKYVSLSSPLSDIHLH